MATLYKAKYNKLHSRYDAAFQSNQVAGEKISAARQELKNLKLENDRLLDLLCHLSENIDLNSRIPTDPVHREQKYLASDQGEHFLSSRPKSEQRRLPGKRQNRPSSFNAESTPNLITSSGRRTNWSSSLPSSDLFSDDVSSQHDLGDVGGKRPQTAKKANRKQVSRFDSQSIELPDFKDSQSSTPIHRTKGSKNKTPSLVVSSATPLSDGQSNLTGKKSNKSTPSAVSIEGKTIKKSRTKTLKSTTPKVGRTPSQKIEAGTKSTGRKKNTVLGLKSSTNGSHSDFDKEELEPVTPITTAKSKSNAKPKINPSRHSSLSDSSVSDGDASTQSDERRNHVMRALKDDAVLYSNKRKFDNESLPLSTSKKKKRP